MSVESFNETFQVSSGVFAENSFGVLHSRFNVPLEFNIRYSSEKSQGSFEWYDVESRGDRYYAEGGLWFQDEELVDYDGVFSLSRFIVIRLHQLGLNVFDMAETLEVDLGEDIGWWA